MPPEPAIALQIEKLVYGGDGLARLPADAKGRRMAVFVPFTLPGEQIEARLLPVKGGMARAELAAVLQPSALRQAPPCPYFGTCGGCHLQHGSYELQLQAKRAILRETFDRARLGLDAEMEIATLAASPWEYRNRIRLHVRTAPAWQAGYLERRSHHFLPISECPVAAPLLQHAIAALASPPIASLAPPELAELEIFCNHDESQMTFAARVSGVSPSLGKAFARWFEACQAAVPQLTGAEAFFSRGPEEHPETAATAGLPTLRYRVGQHDYRVNAGAFFQVNRHLLDALTAHVVHAIAPAEGSTIFDLYAGVGLFSVPLARAGAHVTAVESARDSFRNLSENLLPGASAEAVHSSTEKFLSRSRQEPDAVLVDPPRAGLGAEVSRLLARLAPPVLAYLSCDPTTLARDLQVLLPSGYRVDSVAMIDLFPQTFHQETFVLLRRR